MQVLRIFHVRSLLTLTLLVWATVTPEALGIKSSLSTPIGSASRVSQSVQPTSNSSSQDGPVSVTYGSLYEKGELKIDPYDLTKLPALPDGYVALNNKAYLITTTAIVGPPHVVHFSVASITDEEEFRNLRIFHAEPDTFDPDSPNWFDRTILLPETPASDFSRKRINASSDELGVFVIGKLVQNIPPSTAVADLTVTCTGSQQTVTSPNDIIYVISVTNRGPQFATDVGLINALSPDVEVVSMTSSQGTCKEKSGSIYCRLGSLAANASATLKLDVKPYEGAGSFPPEGKTVANGVWIAAKEADSNAENNRVTETTLVLPDPNIPPSVTIEEPKLGALFVGPVNITIKATATDADGIVSKVEFFDNGKSIGTAIPSEDGRVVITESNVSFGFHSIIAVVTDNGGRQNISNAANIIVNGSAIVKILKPVQGSLIAPDSDVTISVHASHPSGLINKLELFANGESLGEGTPSGVNQYKLELRNTHRALYSIVAVATDGSGITTTSTPANITVNKPPTVNIINPSEGATFPSLYNINITAKASSPDGTIEKVEFYSNGVLIGTSRDVGTDRFMMTWRRLPDGVHVLTAVATDELGVTSKSPPVKISVSNPGPKP